jgi:cytochrome P450
MHTAATQLRSQSEIPRTGLWWILTHALSASGGRIDMLSDLRHLYAQHGRVVLQDVGLIKMINLFGPDANRFVLLDRDRIFSARRPWDMIMGKIFPNGLLLRDGDDHKHHRKIMHEAFKRSALASYAERMNPMIARASPAGTLPRRCSPSAPSSSSRSISPYRSSSASMPAPRAAA